MTTSITESGVTFGPFAKADLFELEGILTHLNYGDDVSKVKFVVKSGSDGSSSGPKAR